MNEVQPLKENMKSAIKIAFVILVFTLITFACENSPSDPANRAEDIPGGIKNLPTLVASEAEATTINIEMVPKSFSSISAFRKGAVRRR